MYKINVYGEKLGADGRRLLSGLEFDRPSRSVDSLGLPDGKKSETHQKDGDARLVQREQTAKAEAQSARSRESTPGPSA